MKKHPGSLRAAVLLMLTLTKSVQPSGRQGLLMKHLALRRIISPTSRALLTLLTCFTGASIAQEFVWSPNLPVGSPLPELRAQDQQGDLRSFEDLRGRNGMLLMLSRFFDW